MSSTSAPLPVALLPGKPLIGRDGTAQRDDRGKVRYAAVLNWEGRAARDRWSDAVLAAIADKHGAEALEPTP